MDWDGYQQYQVYSDEEDELNIAFSQNPFNISASPYEDIQPGRVYKLDKVLQQQQTNKQKPSAHKIKRISLTAVKKLYRKYK